MGKLLTIHQKIVRPTCCYLFLSDCFKYSRQLVWLLTLMIHNSAPDNPKSQRWTDENRGPIQRRQARYLRWRVKKPSCLHLAKKKDKTKKNSSACLCQAMELAPCTYLRRCSSALNSSCSHFLPCEIISGSKNMPMCLTKIESIKYCRGEEGRAR